MPEGLEDKVMVMLFSAPWPLRVLCGTKLGKGVHRQMLGFLPCHKMKRNVYCLVFFLKQLSAVGLK